VRTDGTGATDASGHGDAAGAPLGPRQTRRRAQREAMLVAATDLARRGGYEAVQMRDIAVAVGMSPGSVYNYFDSKDHLLSTIMVDWTQAFAERVERRPPTGANTADRIVEVYERASRTLVREQDLSLALLTAVRLYASTSHDRRAKEAVMDLLSAAVRHAFEPDFPETDREEIVRILSHVWYALLIGWSAGWETLDEIQAEIRMAANRLVAPFEAPAPPAPATRPKAARVTPAAPKAKRPKV
jgi:TetR/AcrR family transcriptional regulator, cholesterol catabolism regulator